MWGDAAAVAEFIATRSTTRFEDMPQRKADYVNKYEPLHPVSSAAAEVSLRGRARGGGFRGKAGKNPQA